LPKAAIEELGVKAGNQRDDGNNSMNMDVKGFLSLNVLLNWNRMIQRMNMLIIKILSLRFSKMENIIFFLLSSK